MKNFIQHDTQQLKLHMMSCKRKHPIIFILNSYLNDTTKLLTSHVGTLAVFLIVLVGFLK